MDIHKFCHRCGVETGKESRKHDLCTRCHDIVFKNHKKINDG